MRRKSLQTANDDDFYWLQKSIDDGNINDGVLQAVKLMKEQKVKELHPYSITPPSKEGKRWITYVRDGNGRKKVTASSKEGLIQILYEHYFESRKITFREMYHQWLDEKKKTNISERTTLRYEQLYRKYYENTYMEDCVLSKINVAMIEDFFYERIKTFGLNKKAFDNMKYILSDTLRLAKRNELIPKNPYLDVKIKSHSFEAKVIYEKDDRIYLDEEKEKFFEALHKEIRKNPENTDCYAIFLLFRWGLRIGELCALKWTDIKGDTIHIQRMETVKVDDNNKTSYIVVNHLKKKSPYANRYLPVGSYEKDILEKVRAISEKNDYSTEYIFCDEEGRTTSREIDNRIRKICRICGLKEKSAHDIRRTVASTLYNNGIPIKSIQNYLGHSDITTTWGYIYDIQNDSVRAKQILDALDGKTVKTFGQHHTY